MILYLTTEQHEGLFDFLIKDSGLVINKKNGVFDVGQFLLIDMKNLDHYQYIIIDIDAVDEEESSLIETIEAFKKMYDVRLVFFVNDKLNPKIYELIRLNEFNIIIDDNDFDVIADQARQATSTNGISKRDICKRIGALEMYDIYEESEGKITQSDAPRWNYNKPLTIVIGGSGQRVGTTTMAINLCTYLASIGAKPAYVEANQHNQLPQIIQDENMSRKANGYEKEGVVFLSLDAMASDEINVTLYDIGVINNQTVNAINRCDVFILCAGVKYHEKEDYKKTFQLINKEESCYFTIFSLSNNHNESSEQKYNADYTPDAFDTEQNTHIWNDIFKEHLC